ncbi:putative phospholipid-translocating P-type ATPase domain-containing protein [Rhizodiscina lignyota]|uniref:Phospholipid-transporting ATPase n=1 Tax=Rhizodiscina lignyota TaxID=1504668 RepID=A0A9P4MA25_9PEZI|nr:putative phospholipid-translocating P-type ATPase domain-containing protein [Rhizodiscina lignyota]
MPSNISQKPWTEWTLEETLIFIFGRFRLSKRRKGSAEDEPAQTERKIYFNINPPDESKDQNGVPKMSYPSNKIRTAKYTALTFIPEDLYLQFHNIANMYFLFVVILNFFAIFGANNPALNAVPLIVILVVTAFKDGLEDWRRTVLDNELNNSLVHRLVDWENVNASMDHVSTWRRIKKACTHGILSFYHSIRSFRKGPSKSDPRDEPDRRPSVVSQRSSYSHHERSVGESPIELTSVNSRAANTPFHDQNSTSQMDSSLATEHYEPKFDPSGSMLNPDKGSSGRARFKNDFWKNIKVGDFVRIYNGDQTPADIVVLSSSEPDGAYYVETKNLDGETNLKARQALKCGHGIRHAQDCEKACFVIESEPPNQTLFTYSGAIRWGQQNGASGEHVEAISINNLLLRGTTLRNTRWILGVVTFTGQETKIMLNSGITPSKRPNLARNLNRNALYNFVILIIMCIIAGFINGFAWNVKHGSLVWFDYGSYAGSASLEGFVAFWVAIILFQNLIPIALYISLDIMRTFQALFIHYDEYMYYEPLDMACVPKRYNVSDDIGQIEYIFSDKTGTLTQNIMEFRKCTVNGVAYGDSNEQDDSEDTDQSVGIASEKARAQTLQILRDAYDNPYLKSDNFTFVSPDFAGDLGGASGSTQQHAVENFLMVLALCNTVLPESTPGDPPEIIYKAESPDDAALVAAARDYGTILSHRKGSDISLNIKGNQNDYTILNVLAFTSARKRMSIIVKMPDGTIRLLTKGADSVIYPRLSRDHEGQDDLKIVTSNHLEMFANEGLRTLCVAERVLDPEEYRVWHASYTLATQALADRDAKVEEVSSALEQQLSLIGGTAIEDRLQNGVPKTISLLADAGIKLWVLTGDRVETAINIGYSCNLLHEGLDLLVFSDPQTAAAKIKSGLDAFKLEGSEEELLAAQKDHRPPPPTHALVIDGESLAAILEDEELERKFLLLCKQCKAVLCCRVSPAQKAAVVLMVKSGLHVMALAIGDGANDVAMIQAADIGVGIAGEEGRQAVMSSDYAIGQFEYLQRLVLVHGRWAYRRIGEATANFFYKNLVWTFTLFWYSIYNNFDGSYLFDYTYIVLVNVAFTSLPVIFMGIFDQDVSDEVSLAVPQLFYRGIERKEWSETKFALYMSDGFYQSIICFFMPYMAWRSDFQHPNGRDIDDRPRLGILVGTAAVIASNSYVLLNSYRWDWLTILINAISSLLIFFWTGVYSQSEPGFLFYQSAVEVYSALAFWAALLVTVTIALLPRLVIKAIQKVIFPRDVDIIREQAIMGKFKNAGKSSKE